MKQQGILVMALLSILSVAGCKKEGAATDPPAATVNMSKYTELKDKMCKCAAADAACATEAATAMESYITLHGKAHKANADKVAPIMAEFDKCKATATGK